MIKIVSKKEPVLIAGRHRRKIISSKDKVKVDNNLSESQEENENSIPLDKKQIKNNGTEEDFFSSGNIFDNLRLHEEVLCSKTVFKFFQIGIFDILGCCLKRILETTAAKLIS